MTDRVIKQFCPACKRGTWFTVKTSGPWTIYTCRGLSKDHPACGHTHRVVYH